MKALVSLCCSLVICGATADILVDPTKPLTKRLEESVVSSSQAVTADDTQTPNSVSDIRLSAVFISPDKRYAMINGQALYEGQSNKNITVKSISRRSVDVIQDGEVKTLTLKKVMTIREHEDKF